MMYPLLTLKDGTEIVYSNKLDNKIKVYVEKPDADDCFHHMTCYLPECEITGVYGFSNEDVKKYMDIIMSSISLSQLLCELNAGLKSAEDEGWISDEDIIRHFQHKRG